MPATPMYPDQPQAPYFYGPQPGGQVGGSYAAMGALGPYIATTSIAANAPIFSLRWDKPDYAMVITGFGAAIGVAAAFTTAQFLTFIAYIARNYTSPDSAGTDYSSIFGTPVKTSMPKTRVSMARAAAAGGFTMITAGTRTLSNSVFATGIYASSVLGYPAAGTIFADSLIVQQRPLIICANEGLEICNGPAAITDTTGSFSVLLSLYWMEIPMANINSYYGT